MLHKSPRRRSNKSLADAATNSTAPETLLFAAHEFNQHQLLRTSNFLQPLAVNVRMQSYQSAVIQCRIKMDAHLVIIVQIEGADGRAEQFETLQI